MPIVSRVIAENKDLKAEVAQLRQAIRQARGWIRKAPYTPPEQLPRLIDMIDEVLAAVEEPPKGDG